MKAFMVKFVVACAMVAISVVCVQAKDLYVAKEKGDNRNAGSKEAPFKNLETALKVAQAGDRILVARGNYTGLRDKGYLEAPQPVELLGGYSPDFATRDIVRYQTTINLFGALPSVGLQEPR